MLSRAAAPARESNRGHTAARDTTAKTTPHARMFQHTSPELSMPPSRALHLSRSAAASAPVLQPRPTPIQWTRRIRPQSSAPDPRQPSETLLAPSRALHPSRSAAASAPVLQPRPTPIQGTRRIRPQSSAPDPHQPSETLLSPSRAGNRGRTSLQPALQYLDPAKHHGKVHTARPRAPTQRTPPDFGGVPCPSHARNQGRTPLPSHRRTHRQMSRHRPGPTSRLTLFN